MSETENKYKLFRNYMVNELGITREDIRAWVAESVATDVRKLVGQINVPEMVRNTVSTEVRQSVRGGYGNRLTDDVRDIIRSAIAEEINGRIHFTNPKEGT